MDAPLTRIGVMSLGLVLSACASWPQNVLVSPEEKIRIAVVPVADVADIRNLNDITHPPEALADSVEEQAAIRRRMQQVAADMTAVFASRLSVNPCIAVVPPSAVSAAAASLPAGALDVDDLRWLGSALHAQAVLRVDLSGYGQIKRKWLVYLIGSGVVEGMAQGVIVGKATTGWAGVVVALEEIAQEVITWGGGAKLFKTWYSPVTLEGRLVNVADGTVLWDDTAFAGTDRKALKKLPKEESARKEIQLAHTAAKAEKELLDDLLKTAGARLHRDCR